MLICASSQYVDCSWGDFNLTSLTELYLTCRYNDSYDAPGLAYTPCRNEEGCGHWSNGGTMVCLVNYDGDPAGYIADGAHWDNGTVQPTKTTNGYTFYYDNGNGGSICPHASATTINWICDQQAGGYHFEGCGTSAQGEICQFWMNISWYGACK